MRDHQIVLPFPVPRRAVDCDNNRDLHGCSYQDGIATITVIETCGTDLTRVMVQRDIDGKTWTMPGWLMRLIFLEEFKRAA